MYRDTSQYFLFKKYCNIDLHCIAMNLYKNELFLSSIYSSFVMKYTSLSKSCCYNWQYIEFTKNYKIISAFLGHYTQLNQNVQILYFWKVLQDIDFPILCIYVHCVIQMYLYIAMHLCSITMTIISETPQLVVYMYLFCNVLAIFICPLWKKGVHIGSLLSVGRPKCCLLKILRTLCLANIEFCVLVAHREYLTVVDEWQGQLSGVKLLWTWENVVNSTS